MLAKHGYPPKRWQTNPIPAQIRICSQEWITSDSSKNLDSKKWISSDSRLQWLHYIGYCYKRVSCIELRAQTHLTMIYFVVLHFGQQWKKPRTKVANLRKLGIPADKAYQWGNSRLGYWRIAGSPVLKCSITNERLAAAGYFSILNYYESLHLCCWTAVYRSVRTVVWEVGYLFERASYLI